MKTKRNATVRSLSLSLFLLLLAAPQAYANCAVSIPSKTLIYEGHAIHFVMEELLESMGYHEADSGEPAKYILRIEAEVKNSRPFREFQATYSFLDADDDSAVTIAEGRKKCIFTDLCSISDVRKAFERGYAELKKALPLCPAS